MTGSTTARRALVTAAVLVAASLPTGASLAAPPPHVARGDAVEARYQRYRGRLEALYHGLASRLTADAPDLLPKLAGVPPATVVHGYQILPPLGADSPPPTERPRARSTRYSWPWTDRMIERELEKIDALEAALAKIASLTGDARRAAYEKMAGDYEPLPANQRTIDAHIQHNRLWQAAIAANRAGYDEETSLHDAVVERQAVRDALGAPDERAVRAAAGKIAGIDAARPLPVLWTELAARTSALERRIAPAIERLARPPFLRVERRAAHRWVVQMPLYTDIENAEFVRAFKAAVERVWQLQDGPTELAVEVIITPVAPAQLYPPSACAGAAARCGPPATGERIEVSEHVARFPGGGGILTTGAASTHVWGRAIVLGPHAIAPRVLAHEFGHLLGFPDFYFRGYRDLGADGYEVLEVVAEPDDIMGNPGVGLVHRRHFELLIGKALLTRGGAAAENP